MSHSHELYLRAQRTIPGGVNSPVRAFKAVGCEPLFITHGEGPYLYDSDGKRYVDYIGSWGPLILGHNHPAVNTAVKSAVDKGLSFGAATEKEIILAEKICELMPAIEMIRMVNSGTEATMSAIRLARGYTGRNKIIKFEGNYHGHSDALLVKAGSGALTFGHPSSPGVPTSFTEHTLVANFNDLDNVRALFDAHGDDIAAIILEPIAGNMNCVPATESFIKGLRELCDRFGSVLIFDEVMTGFRVALGGAQSLYGVTPCLTTLGKVIGGGMPVGAFGGRKDIMSHLSPLGPVYQAGTLSGNPVAMAAGIAMLDEISKPGFFDTLSATTQQLVQGITAAAETAQIPFTSQQIGGMFGMFFTNEPEITRFEQVMACDGERFVQFFQGMLNEGIYLAPSAFEAGFVSSAHDDEAINSTIDAAQTVFAALK